MRIERLVWTVLLGLSALTVACGGEDTGEATGGTGGGVSLPPKQEFDAEVPLPVTERDAGMRIAGDVPEGIEGACGVDSNKVFEVVRNDKSPFSTPMGVDQNDSRFGLAYLDLSETCIDALYLAHLKGPPGSGGPESVLAVDQCSEITEAAVAHTGQDWLVATVDNRDNGSDIWTQLYDPDTGKAETGTRITNDLDLVESRVVLAASPQQDFAMLAWVEAPRDGSSRTLKAQRLDKQGAPVGEPQTVDGGANSTMLFTSLSMEPMPAQAGGDPQKVFLAYNRFEADGPGEIVLQVLDEDGAPTKAEWILTSSAGQDGHVDLATGSEVRGKQTGGVVYSMRVGTEGRQLWFQGLDKNGEASRLVTGGNVDRGPAPAKRLVNTPRLAASASIARLPTGVGFVVAYRDLAINEAQQTKVRVIFTDREGSINVESDLAFASEIGGQTNVQASFDGRFVVGWSEVNEEGETIYNLVRLPCSG